MTKTREHYSVKEEADMCAFLVEIAKEKRRISPKSPTFWEEFVKRRKSKRTVHSLVSHFARILWPNIYRTKMPYADLFLVLKHFSFPLTPSSKEFLERKFDCFIVTSGVGLIEDHWHKSSSVKIKRSRNPPSTSWDFSDLDGSSLKQMAKEFNKIKRRPNFSFARGESPQPSTSTASKRDASVESIETVEDPQKKQYSPIHWLQEYPSWAKFTIKSPFEGYWDEDHDDDLSFSVDEDDDGEPELPPPKTKKGRKRQTKPAESRTAPLKRRKEVVEAVPLLTPSTSASGSPSEQLAEDYVDGRILETQKGGTQSKTMKHLLPVDVAHIWPDCLEDADQVRVTALRSLFKLISLLRWNVDEEISGESQNTEERREAARRKREVAAARLLIQTSKEKEREIFEKSTSKVDYLRQFTTVQRELTEILERVKEFAENVEDEDEPEAEQAAREEGGEKDEEVRKVLIDDDVVSDEHLEPEPVVDEEPKLTLAPETAPPALEETIQRVPCVEPFNINLLPFDDVDPATAVLSRRQRVYILRSLVNASSPGFAQVLQNIEAKIFRNSKTEAEAVLRLHEESEKLVNFLKNFPV